VLHGGARPHSTAPVLSAGASILIVDAQLLSRRDGYRCDEREAFAGAIHARPVLDNDVWGARVVGKDRWAWHVATRATSRRVVARAIDGEIRACANERAELGISQAWRRDGRNKGGMVRRGRGGVAGGGFTWDLHDELAFVDALKRQNRPDVLNDELAGTQRCAREQSETTIRGGNEGKLGKATWLETAAVSTMAGSARELVRSSREQPPLSRG
jgi:hypothetical protein